MKRQNQRNLRFRRVYMAQCGKGNGKIKEIPDPAVSIWRNGEIETAKSKKSPIPPYCTDEMGKMKQQNQRNP
ncbi:MAG: hypothetical protein J5546_09895 [Lachnospiraceae bacterium]|nr:hypothetical protein [Lachnospiraceae bacterium]